MERLKSSFLNPAELGQSSDVLYEKRPLREHLISSLKVLGKFALGAIVFGGGTWLLGNTIIDAFSQPIPVTASLLASKEMVIGFSVAIGLGGGLWLATT